MRLAVPTLDRPQPASLDIFAGCLRRSQRAVPIAGRGRNGSCQANS